MFVKLDITNLIKRHVHNVIIVATHAMKLQALIVYYAQVQIKDQNHLVHANVMLNIMIME